MRRALQLIFLVGLAAFAWRQNHQRQPAVPAAFEPGQGAASPSVEAPASDPPASDPPLRCDGRVYCSQMHSCAEATWFLQHCSGMKMDGDRDGIPCEKQWCD